MRVRSARPAGLLTPRRCPNALRAPLPSRPRLPERPQVHPLLQRDSGGPAPAGIVRRARALTRGDAARGQPKRPGRFSVSGRLESSCHSGDVRRLALGVNLRGRRVPGEATPTRAASAPPTGCRHHPRPNNPHPPILHFSLCGPRRTRVASFRRPAGFQALFNAFGRQRTPDLRARAFPLPLPRRHPREAKSSL